MRPSADRFRHRNGNVRAVSEWAGANVADFNGRYVTNS